MEFINVGFYADEILEYLLNNKYVELTLGDFELNDNSKVLLAIKQQLKSPYNYSKIFRDPNIIDKYTTETIEVRTKEIIFIKTYVYNLTELKYRKNDNISLIYYDNSLDLNFVIYNRYLLIKDICWLNSRLHSLYGLTYKLYPLSIDYFYDYDKVYWGLEFCYTVENNPGTTKTIKKLLDKFFMDTHHEYYLATF